MSLTPRMASPAALCALVGLLVLLAVPAIAQAAPPDRTATVSASASAFAWDGPPGTGTYAPVGGYDPEACNKEAANYCDITLVNVQSGGPVGLELKIFGYSDPTSDFDLYLYKSDSTGVVGEQVNAENDGPTPVTGPTGLPAGFEETHTNAALEPGYYLVIVAYFLTNESSYKGSFTVTGATPVAGGGTTPPPGGGTTPPPSGGTTPPPSGGTPPPSSGSTLTTLPFKAASSLGSLKKAKKKKALSFKATATEAITNLKLKLLDARKGSRTVYGTATIASFPEGSRVIKLKINRKLKKKGKYTLLATGTAQGKSLAVSQAVTVKK